jgi:hypothetical protein
MRAAGPPAAGASAAAMSMVMAGLNSSGSAKTEKKDWSA